MKVNCYLTFDDGPFSYTSTILNILQAKGIKATFFLTGKSMANSSAKQYMLVKKMIDNGHAIGNHGYDHDPMTRKGYKNSATADVKSDFIENHDYFTRLFEKNHDNFPGFSCARLPGDGRFMKRFVTMITNDIQIAHINWNIEFSTNGRMGHLAHKDWQGVKGVSCSKSDFPSGRDIILLHDLHWRGKELMLKQLLSKLQEKVIFKALDKIPPGHHAVKQAT